MAKCNEICQTCYACNMGMRDLPDNYAQDRGHASPVGECGHIRQILTTHVKYMLCNTSDTKNLLSLPFTVLPLYIMMNTMSSYEFFS